MVTRLLKLPGLILWRALFWTYERATWQYDLMVIAILAFVWLTPPDWIGDPMAAGPGAAGLVLEQLNLTWSDLGLW
jgi:hypothetical protein